MEAEDDTNYYVILPFVLGSMIQYRYQRQGSTLSQEHLPDGRPVRYRLYHVEGPGIVEDIVSRWTNTTFEGFGGELRGQLPTLLPGFHYRQLWSLQLAIRSIHTQMVPL